MSTKKILKPFELNKSFELKNRIVMAPMTRLKTGSDLTPTQQVADYYARRADAGLIITEGTIIAPNGKGHDGVPGQFDESHIAGWKQVTDKVHENNGIVFNQIWHVGRVSHPSLLSDTLPISASATTMNGRIPRMEGFHYGSSREVSPTEIKELISKFQKSAENAIKAGFDGVELHGANGYLIDQFLHYHTNHRTDFYGGSPENMARFAYEIVKACGEAIDYDRVGIRLSPAAYLNEIDEDERDANVFVYLLRQLNTLPIAYVHTGNYNHTQQFKSLDNMTMIEFIRRHYKGVLIACGGYDLESGENAILNNEADLIAMGRPFIANSDLITRFKKKMDVVTYDPVMLQTLY